MENNLISEEQQLDNRKRTFLMILYPDTTSYNYNDVISYIRSLKYYAFIKHLPESDEKKVHTHVLLYFENSSTIERLSKLTSIPIQHIKYCKSFRQSCRYLTHIDWPDKIQYDISDVVVSRGLQRRFLQQYEDIKTEEEIISDIYNYIDELKEFNDYKIKLKSLIVFVNSNCYDSIYKRYRTEFLSYLNS